jgi:hypothetical protein
VNMHVKHNLPQVSRDSLPCGPMKWVFRDTSCRYIHVTGSIYISTKQGTHMHG